MANPKSSKFQLWIIRQRKAGRTAADVADDLGVTRQAIDLWVKGKRKPSARQLTYLAQVTGLEIGELLE